MRVLDLTLPSPAENLALDEALLLEAEEARKGETLRFWTSPTPFVVLGLGGKLREEVDVQRCEREGIPILRRCSGGGTVVQGPGCLNYSLVLEISGSCSLASISSTNRMVMERNAKALTEATGQHVEVAGHTDLTVSDRKVSGNAQRRMRRSLLFHGTFLLASDLRLIGSLLPLPKLQPAYRRRRAHDEFLTNLDMREEEIKNALSTAWVVHRTTEDYPISRVRDLVASRYGTRQWNFRR